MRLTCYKLTHGSTVRLSLFVTNVTNRNWLPPQQPMSHCRTDNNPVSIAGEKRIACYGSVETNTLSSRLFGERPLYCTVQCTVLYSTVQYSKLYCNAVQ